MAQKSWPQALSDGVLTGSIACAATAATAAACGARESGSGVAAINAVSHIIWGRDAARTLEADVKHTLSGLALNEGASVFWAVLYERAFGDAADRGETGKALLGGGAIAGLAYVTDYYLVPKRLTPGWEERVSDRSLAVIYIALALSLPLRGLLRSRLAKKS
jgi:hypothetical protein